MGKSYMAWKIILWLSMVLVLIPLRVDTLKGNKTFNFKEWVLTKENKWFLSLHAIIKLQFLKYYQLLLIISILIGNSVGDTFTLKIFHSPGL